MSTAIMPTYYFQLPIAIDHGKVVAVRGKGLMLGIELDRPCRDILIIGLKHRLLFNVTADRVIRLLPPLIINKEEADQIVLRLHAIIKEFLQA